MTQIRVLQLLLTFLNPTTTVLSKELVNSIVQCCFHMVETKSNAVRSTIQASLKQLVSLVTDQFNAEPESIIQGIVYDLCFQIATALALFESQAATGKKASVLPWNLKPSTNTRCILLDLTNLILQLTKQSLVNNNKIVRLFEETIVPLLMGMMANKQVNSIVYLRQMKCAILIFQHL